MLKLGILPISVNYYYFSTRANSQCKNVKINHNTKKKKQRTNPLDFRASFPQAGAQLLSEAMALCGKGAVI